MIQFMTVLKAYTELNGELSVNEQVLFFRLFLINNKAGWPEWFGADNRRLLLETGIKSMHTIISARNSLKQKGIIDFLPGKKGQVTRYTLTPLLPKYGAPDTLQSIHCNQYSALDTLQQMHCNKYTASIAPKNAPKDGKGASDALKNAPKTEKGASGAPKNAPKDGTEKKGASIAPKNALKTAPKNAPKNAPIIDIETRDKETAAAAASDEHAISEVMTAFSNNIHPVTGEIERDALLDFCTSYGCNWTLAAIKEAAVNNGRSVRYIDAILRRWQAQGFPSAKSATAQPQAKSAYDPKKPEGPDNRPPDIPKNWVWNGCGWEEPFVE